MLSDSEPEGENIHQLTVNEHYAKALQHRKEREEHDRLKEIYGSDVDSGASSAIESDSEEDETEDEDGEELTPMVDAAILRTLAKIKRQDPEIYTAGKQVFGEEQEKVSSAHGSKSRTSKKMDKPVTLRDLRMESVLNPTSRSPSPSPVPHVEEQRALKEETINAFRNAARDPDSDSGDDLLVLREKTKDEVEREEEEYRTFLEREVGEDLSALVTVESGDVRVSTEKPKTEDESTGRKKKGSNGKEKEKPQQSDQDFLINYILNRGWVDQSSRRVPTYKEITSTSREKGKAKAENIDELGGSSAEEEDIPSEEGDEGFDELAEDFEHSYNYRYEEPGATTIASFPRQLSSLVRREDTTRREARVRKKERKDDELLKKKEEIKRLKALKAKEIAAKLERIGREGGRDVEALRELDIDGEWDPDAHDMQMNTIYGHDDIPEDLEKPQWGDEIEIDDILPPEPKSLLKKKKKKKDEIRGKGGGVDIDDMDADFIRLESDEDEWDGTEEGRKRRAQKYMDELYDLDFNDMVGGMPTRFKYNRAEPQAFALTPVEILMATDAELNQYMSVKKYAPYRTENKRWDHTRNDRLRELKEKLKEREAPGEEGAENAPPAKKRKGRKERMKLKLLKEEKGSGAIGETKIVERADGDDRGKKRKAEDVDLEGDENLAGKKKKKRSRKKPGVA